MLVLSVISLENFRKQYNGVIMSIEIDLINQNITKLQSFMAKEGLETFYISSFDNFLNEYVPLEDCHRYYLSGFSGSVAELLVTLDAKAYLFVDGRYHEQADSEIKSKHVEIVKCNSVTSNTAALVAKLKELGSNSIGIEGNRSSEAFYETLNNFIKVKSFDEGELVELLDFGIFESTPRIESPKKESDWGGSTTDKLKLILNENEAYYISALDSIAWLSNIRGFEQPFQSTYLAKCLATHNHLYIFVSEDKYFKDIKHEDTSIIKINNWSLKEGLTHVDNASSITKVSYDKNAMNHADYFALENLFGKSKIIHSQGGIVEYHSVKNQVEMKLIREAFDKADNAIFDTINTVKEIVKSDAKITELDFFNLANKIYEDGGSKEQSFNTISGVGKNSSLPHFGKPSADVIVGKKDLMLFDSGAFYEGGFATDTTRSFSSSDTPEEWQIEIYTYVLKGLLHAQNAIFPVGTFGGQIDMLARQPLLKAGYNYAHGTGHGVGINVHESGLRISPLSTVPLVEGKIGSLEPGIYLSGKGGVRLENIVEVVKHSKYNNMLCFRSLVYVGFDKSLINYDLLTNEETVWLEEYESECAKRNRVF